MLLRLPPGHGGTASCWNVGPPPVPDGGRDRIGSPPSAFQRSKDRRSSRVPNDLGLLITTEAMVAERPKKEGGAPAMPGGGMGGMAVWTTRHFPADLHRRGIFRSPRQSR